MVTVSGSADIHRKNSIADAPIFPFPIFPVPIISATQTTSRKISIDPENCTVGGSSVDGPIFPFPIFPISIYPSYPRINLATQTYHDKRRSVTVTPVTRVEHDGRTRQRRRTKSRRAREVGTLTSACETVFCF
uniref:Uncharacterized protein n=1 Tax=Steinernema glaseri TaxID=37863 RepID=A0A1I7ZIP2_9BILA